MSDRRLLWLWPEAGGVRIWLPEGTQRLERSAPGPYDLRLTASRLRDGLEALALDAALHPELAGLVRAGLGAGAPLELRLARGLPRVWRDFPYERLQADGEMLMGRLVVAREAPFPHDHDTALAASRALALNLWPRTEAVQPLAGLGACWPCLRIEPSPRTADHSLARLDLREVGLLVVVAHGSEGRGEAPFRLPDGTGWSLPTGRGVPALVILLACGDEEGNLLATGCELLAAGARSVLAPCGRLDARGARAFLKGFLADWLDAGLSVADALRKAQAADRAERFGAQRLCLLGEAGLRWRATPDPAYTTTVELEVRAREELVAATPPVALPALCERQTLLILQRQGTLDELRLPFGENQEAALLQRLHPLLDQLSPLTQCWALPMLAGLAESHDHGLLDEFAERRCRFEQARPESVPPAAFHHWSKVHYRQGRYVLVARDLVMGLNRVPAARLSEQGLGLLGALLNLLIDQRMIAPARRVEQLLEQSLNLRDDELAVRHRRDRVDRSARLDLREGKVDAARCLYRRRWCGNPNDQRALNWLLYLAAWHPDPKDGEYLAIARARFASSELSPALAGNDDRLYRLRALAAWAYGRDDAAVAAAIAPAISFCQERLTDHPRLDAGPPGFVLAFLDLQAGRQGTPPVWAASLPSWDCWATALREQRYFLELAAFAALRGDAEKTRALLGKVCKTTVSTA